MSEKKNIDRLFQEKFKDFEASPPDFVWDNIREKLEEKKKRRVIPFWYKLSGVAAVLILGLLLGGFYLNAVNPDNNPVVNNPAAKQSNPLPLPASPIVTPSGDIKNNNNKGTINNDNQPVNSAIVTNDQDARNSNGTLRGKNSSVVSKSNKARLTNAKNNAVANTNNNANKTSTKGRHIVAQPATGVAASQNKGGKVNLGKAQKGQNLNAETTIYGRTTKNNTAVAASQNKGSKVNSGKAQNGQNLNAETTIYGSTTKSNTAVAASRNMGSKANSGKVNNGQNLNAETTINGSTTKNNTAVAASQNKGNEANTNAAAGTTDGTNPSGVIDTTIPLKEQAVAQVAIDTTAVPENELEKLLREKLEGEKENKDKEVAQTDVKNKWSVKPQLAPVFYNSLSKGSPIDTEFAGNSKSYDNDLSYGLGVNYAVNSRLKVRSGINTVNLNYATQNVQFYASLEGQTKNVAARSSNANIVVQDQKNNVVDPSLLFANNTSGDKYDGAMLQKTGYVEVPVEMSYALINKNFGIDIIGGVSTLFLNQNNVSVVSTQGLSTSVGQAQNLNNIHFSTNVGLGFKYRFFKAFEANFEPMFKYQVNTFSRDAGNFKPYFIGLYSGISFSF